jgi:hypothetical protein
MTSKLFTIGLIKVNWKPMSTSRGHGFQSENQLEFWRAQRKTRNSGTGTEELEEWTVEVVRILVGTSPKFEVQFFESGSLKFSWIVPKSAHAALSKVFRDGGSFLGATMKHMGAAWRGGKKTHPHFFALYEQLTISQVTPNAVSASIKWTRL